MFLRNNDTNRRSRQDSGVSAPKYELSRGLERQIIPFEDQIKQPLNKSTTDPRTRMRVANMIAIEAQQIDNYHHWWSETGNAELRELFAFIRRAEDIERTVFQSLVCPGTSPLEQTILLEQLATEYYATFAMEEPDPYVATMFDYILLEDLEHFHNFAERLRYLEGQDVSSVTWGYTLVEPARPLEVHHLPPVDTMKKPYNKKSTDPITRYHLHTLQAQEKYTEESYRNFISMVKNPDLKQLYAEIGHIEETHVSTHESLFDPMETLLERAVAWEWTEYYTYAREAWEETNPVVKAILEQFREWEKVHLQKVSEALERFEGKDPAALTTTKYWDRRAPYSVNDHIRWVLDTQLDRRSKGEDYVQDGNVVMSPGKVPALH